MYAKHTEIYMALNIICLCCLFFFQSICLFLAFYPIANFFSLKFVYPFSFASFLFSNCDSWFSKYNIKKHHGIACTKEKKLISVASLYPAAKSESQYNNILNLTVAMIKCRIHKNRKF